MKAISIYAFAGLSLLFGLPSAFAANEVRQPCLGLAGANKENCQAAFNLLTKEQDNVPEFKIFASGKASGWKFRYDAADVMCIESTELRLPHDQQLTLLYTSADYANTDELPTLRIDKLGVNVTAIPGRISELAIKAQEEGKLEVRAGREAFRSQNTQESKADHVVLAEVISPNKFRAWMKENGRRNCDD